MFLKGRRNGGASQSTALVPASLGAQRPLPRNAAPSIITADLHIVGNVTTEGELLIDGRVDGDINCHSVTIGDSGHVVGHVETEEIVVYGVVTGSIRARRVRLAGGCKVLADITHHALTIDAGASFEGQCRRVLEGEDRPGPDRDDALP